MTGLFDDAAIQVALGRIRLGDGPHPRGEFPWAIDIRHPKPDPLHFVLHERDKPFSYRIRARTELDATSIVSHFRGLGCGAVIAEVEL